MSIGQGTVLGLCRSCLALPIYLVACPFMFLGKLILDLGRFVDPDYPKEYQEYEAEIRAKNGQNDSRQNDG